MFAYCLNNPVNLIDSSGKSATVALLVAGLVTVAISALANGVSTAASGGTVEECFVAAGIGALGGGIGFAVSWATGFSPWGCVGGRAAATVTTDILTTWAINGTVTGEDVGYIFLDTTMDVCFTVMGNYYTPANLSQEAGLIFGAGIDGMVDVSQAVLFANLPNQQQTGTQSVGYSAPTSTGIGSFTGRQVYVMRAY